MANVRVLLVEDNDDLRDSIQAYFENENYYVYACRSAEEAESLMANREFSIGVIDVNLPKKNGFELISDIRKTGAKMPLIALTARDSVEDKVRGFELGLTDYVVKPFSLAELVARMRAHLRANSNDHEEILTSSLVIRPESRQVFVNNKEASLTATEFRILEVLARNKGKIVAFDDIIAYAWGEQIVTTKNRYAYTSEIFVRKLKTKSYLSLKLSLAALLDSFIGRLYAKQNKGHSSNLQFCHSRLSINGSRGSACKSDYC